MLNKFRVFDMDTLRFSSDSPQSISIEFVDLRYHDITGHWATAGAVFTCLKILKYKVQSSGARFLGYIKYSIR
jgi:hypothetical protein